MKIISVLLLATSFLVSGTLNILKQIKITNALDEVVRFINIVKTEVHYTTADYEKIFAKGKSQNYKYISFFDNQIYLNKTLGGYFDKDFNDFISKIGTTDDVGQLNICDEYKARFEDVLSKRKIKEKEKLQVNTALSLFGALTVLIFFL